MEPLDADDASDREDAELLLMEAREAGDLRARCIAAADEHHSELVYDRSLPAAEHEAAFEALHAEDEKAERYKSRFTGLGCLGGGGLLLVTPILGDWLHERQLLPVGIGASLLVIVVAVLGHRRFGRNDLDDRKVALPRYVLDVLGPELKPSRPVDLRLDFQAFHRTTPVVDEAGSDFVAGRREFRHEGWLKMRLPLLDGTRLGFTLSTRVKRKQERKRKYVKRKDQRLEIVDVDVELPPGRELDPARTDEVRARFASEGDVELVACRLAGRRAKLRFRFGPARLQFLRTGWTDTLVPALADGDKLIGALQFAYKAAAAATKR